jgi:hypothetical protein
MALTQFNEAQNLARGWRAKHGKKRNPAMPPLMEGGQPFAVSHSMGGLLEIS